MIVWDWIREAFGKLRPDIKDGWLTFAEHIPMHPSWRYSDNRAPSMIVAHYTATDPGTARNMAKRRVPKRKPEDRAASWHVSIETDGTVIQMAPFTASTWHAGAANRTSVGIELVGHGKVFPEAQVAAAERVWRAIVREYGISRERAMVEHSALDPERRRDPGPVWMGQHAERVLDYAYAR